MERAYQRLLLLVTVPVIVLVAALSAWQYWTERARLIEGLERSARDQRLVLDTQLKAARDYIAVMRERVERALAGPPRFDADSVLWPRLHPVPRANGAAMTVASLDHLAGTPDEAGIAAILGDPGPTLAAPEAISAAIELFGIMREVHAGNADFIWSYFYAADGRFISIYPFRPSAELLAPAQEEDMRLIVDGWHTIDALRMSLPGVNPEGASFWTPAYDDPAGRGWIVSHGAPVHGPDGRYAGGVGVDFAAEQLAATLAGLRPAIGETLLVSGDGQILAGSGLPQGRIDVTEATLVPPTPLLHAPWMLVHVVPEHGVPLYLLPRLAPYGAILLALLAAVLAAHLLMQRRFVRPSLRLLQHIQAEAEDRARPPDLPDLWRPWAELVSHAFGSSRDVRRRLEEAEARFLAAVDSIPDGLAIFDAEDRLVFHNRRYPDHALPALRQALRIGRTFEEMIRDAVASGPVYHPDMGPDFAERRLAMRQETDMEHEFRLADGRWLRIRENRMRDGGRVQLTSDISAAKAAEIAIRESELRYRAVVETQTEFVTRITPEGRLTFCNDAYVRHVGLPRDVLLSPDFVDFDLIAPEDREKYARRLAALTPGQPTASMELRSVLPDGRRTLEEWTDTGVFDAAGRLVEIQATGRDVTEQRRVEAELARQREALHQSEKLAALGSLLAGVAHELNNPLSIVTGYATMLRDLSTDEATRRRGEMIHTAAERCARIVRSFLALARSEPRATAPVQLNALVEAALEMLAYGLRTADVAVEQRLDPALPTVVGDGDQLHQVVTNLVINAQQAMQGQTTPRRLTVTTAARDDEVVVEVADSGPGVPEALRARIFDPFFTTKPVGVGTGLGLSVSRGIVLAHRGSLETEGAPGGGALFRVLRDRHPDLLPRLILMTGDVLGAGLAASVSELLAPLSEKPPLLEKPVDQDALRRVVAERLATAGPREEHAP